MKAYVDGYFIPERAGAPAPSDRGFQFGLGVFTTLAVRRRLPLFWADHAVRLRLHAGLLGLQVPRDSDLLRALMEGLSVNRLANGTAKIMIAAGPGTLRRSGRSTRTIILYGRPRPRPRSLQLLVTPYTPSPWRSIKSLNYLDSLWLLQHARTQGCHDALACSENQLLETATANLFVVTRQGIFTPPADGRILAGVARGRLLGEHALEIRERAIEPGHLRNARAVFVTNSVRGVMPVASIWDHRGRRLWHTKVAPEPLRAVQRTWARIVRDEWAQCRIQGVQSAHRRRDRTPANCVAKP